MRTQIFSRMKRRGLGCCRKPSTIQTCNFAHYALEMLQHGAYRARCEMPTPPGGVELDGCLLALQMFFLDNKKKPGGGLDDLRSPRIAEYARSAFSEYIKDLVPCGRGIDEILSEHGVGGEKANFDGRRIDEFFLKGSKDPFG